MKNLLVLPGNSLRNKAWGEQCLVQYADLFDESTTLYYDHWENGEAVADFETEIGKIANLVEQSAKAKWYIFAKSIGSLIALVAIHQRKIQPEQVVFFGMPLDHASEGVFKNDWSSLSDLQSPVLAFHNDHDPTTSYDFTKSKLHELAPLVEFETLAGDNHDYLDFFDYRSAIKKFLR